ncbi:hypothetical protein KFU94_12335 [Chloroflexi bacterium TSY]|nr:hypothetical protein [Chloroflexi bacterium TSY]
MAAQKENTLWDGLVAGCHTWLEAASDPMIQKILILDAPAVLGWERWREMDAESSASLLRASLKELEAAEIIVGASTEALFHLLNGAMNHAALWIVQEDDSAQALQHAKNTLEQLLNGLIQQG